MNKDLLNNADQIARATISVIDALTQRGAFKGEELSVIGGLRDQCTILSQQVEMEKDNNENESES